MTAIAIPAAAKPFGNNQDDLGFGGLSCSPLSRSPFAHQLSLSPTSAPKYSSSLAFTSTAPAPRKASFNAAARRPSISFAPVPKPSPIVPEADPLPIVHSGSIMSNFEAALSEIDLDSCEAHGENALFVADLAVIYAQHQRWMRELGQRVMPFFAVKSNPDPYVLRLMAAMGLGFDCASHPEISGVLALGVKPERIIYANPCKAASFIRNAQKSGVDTMTFDNADELAKVKKFHPNAKMVLRILTDDSSSLCRLGLKFGAPLAEVRGLMKRARQLNVDVVGISFHCGSGCKDPTTFGDAIRRAKWAFEVGAEEGFSFDLLDIGGGFEDENFEAIAAILRDAIEEHFPLEGAGKGVKIIAEPGRYYVSKAFELATNIIARRKAREETSEVEGLEVEDEEGVPSTMYYINDGVYSSFNSTMFDHQIVHPHILTLSSTFTPSPPAAPLSPCSIWGPTCDSIDCVQSNAMLPVELVQVGDWLRWDNMGAYTICAASQFNGFRRSDVRYTIDAGRAVEGKIRSLLRA
ncbi:hypothetical protein JCM11641_004818 [Rhodosporidiobolus odoratus]